MSVILQVGNITVSQGWSGSMLVATLINSGTENVKQVKMKVTDSVIFDSLWYHNGASDTKCYGEGTCLNVFGNYLCNRTNGNWLFPEGTTKAIQFSHVVVKANAPIEIHNLTCDFQYVIY